MEMNRSISADSDWFALFVKQLSHLWMTSGLWPEIKSRFHSLYNREYFYIYVSNRNHSPFQLIYFQVKIEVFFFNCIFVIIVQRKINSMTLKYNFPFWFSSKENRLLERWSLWMSFFHQKAILLSLLSTEIQSLYRVISRTRDLISSL